MANYDQNYEGGKDAKDLYFLRRHALAVRKHLDSVIAIKEHIGNDDVLGVKECWGELTSEQKMDLTHAPTKGGIWWQHEKEYLDSLGRK